LAISYVANVMQHVVVLVVLEVRPPAVLQILSEDELRANSVNQHPEHLRDSLTRSEYDFAI
jgi:hypothetical protein